MPPLSRFRDPRHTNYRFVDTVLVRCPKCAEVAHVVPGVCLASDASRPSVSAPRRLICRNCGLTRESGDGPGFFTGNGQACDPYFQVPLWLQLETRHGWLWAYNLEHLELIRQFVQAPLRERAPWHDRGRKMTLIARLPAWIKRAKNRAEVLRAVERIRSSLVT
ncbi:hypothetical protein ACF08N_37010 [Streptomyces sp. NPDC015127]|uniref:hypothetical protein n=1 Tax=Streptomyces sp. NPDC015127 TaxID=3364939 RepID=UPI0036FA016D